MIRNVVLGKLRADADVDALDAALQVLRELPLEGIVSIETGRDLRLRDGCWDFAITADFVDEAAYLRYDTDTEHNRLRAEVFGPQSEQVVRVQFRVDG